MRNHEHPGTSETTTKKCIVCKAVDRKRALSEQKNNSKLLENSPERMNDAKRFVVCFPLQLN